MKATPLLLSIPPPPVLPSKLPTLTAPRATLCFPGLLLKPKNNRGRRFWPVRADDGDGDGGGGIDEYDLDSEEAEEFDNKKDFDVDYHGGDDEELDSKKKDYYDIEVNSLVDLREGWWGSETSVVVDYRINEDDFYKISLLDCDFFIRKPPDPDNDVYDFGEMYITPPDTDVYYIPEVLAPMPKKPIRCAESDYGRYNVTEPPIDAPRDPMYKSEKEILKVFLTKHYRNRRHGDPEFVLDFEEIYVIDSKTKSITRAKVLVTVPGGRNRDRKSDLLVISDNGTSFKIIPMSEREDATSVIEREDWEKSRQDMERHLSKLKDFNYSNWF